MSEQQEKTGTAVARREEGGGSEMEKLGAEGRARLERIRETKELSRAIQGIQFGDVDGSGLSPATRYQIAKMCIVMEAEPSQHVDILGGQPYFNAAYWAEEINSHERYVDHNQREISEATEEQLRETAASKRELASDFDELAEADGDEDLAARARRLKREAAELEEEATELPLLRQKYGVPDWATHVVETTIERFVSSAPMEEIHAGRQDPEPWIKAVAECNWAGGKGDHKAEHEKGNKAFGWDPIGDANPAKSARTRSLRRCAVKAFPAWREKFRQYRDKIERLIEREQALMAEYGDDLPDGGPPALSTAGGEPEAASSEGARALPEGEASAEEPEVVSEAEASEAEPAPAPSASSTAPGETEAGEDDEEEDAELSPVEIERRAYFRNLRDAGITPKGMSEEERREARYAWQEEQGLPQSTKDWELAHWRQANRTLTAEVRKTYQEACEVLDIDADRLAEGHLDRPARMIRDYESLIEKLESASTEELEDAMEGEGGEPSLDL